MKRLSSSAFLLFGLCAGLFFSPSAHAENGCPDGMTPFQDANMSGPSCAPIPNYEGQIQANQLPAEEPKFCHAVDSYGAIAWTSGIKDVWAVANFPNKNEARKAAIKLCKKSGYKCSVAADIYNGMGIVTIADDGVMRVATGSVSEETVTRAIQACTATPATGCKPYRAFESTQWMEKGKSLNFREYHSPRPEFLKK